MRPGAELLLGINPHEEGLTGRQQSVRYRFPSHDGLAQRRRTLPSGGVEWREVHAARVREDEAALAVGSPGQLERRNTESEVRG